MESCGFQRRDFISGIECSYFVFCRLDKCKKKLLFMKKGDYK